MNTKLIRLIVILTITISCVCTHAQTSCPTGKTYAVIIMGNAEIGKTTYHQWNDCRYVYSVLRNKYNIPKYDIIPLIADGTDPAEDMLGYSGNIISTPLDIDEDGVNDIELSASKLNIYNELNKLEKKLTAYDQLLIVILCHGINENDEPYIEIWGPDPMDTSANVKLYANELKQLIHPFCKKMVSVNIVSGSCYSGAFIDVLRTERCVISVACSRNEKARMGRMELPFSPFIYYWTSAINGEDTNGSIIDADLDKNGIISMYEAFQYSYGATQKYVSDTFGISQYPQFYSAPQMLGSELAINTHPVINDEDYYDLKFNSYPSGVSCTDSVANQIFWDNPDISITHYNDQNTTESDFHSNNTYNVSFTIHNNGDDAYCFGKKIVTYWAQSSTNIPATTWRGENYLDDEYPLGGKFFECEIPGLARGESITIDSVFTCPDAIIEDEYRPDNHDFCFLAKITDIDIDPSNSSLSNILEDSQSAYSNASFLPANTGEQSAATYIHNPNDTAETFSLEIGYRTEQDKDLLNYAHIALETKGTLFNSWYNRGGGRGNDIIFYGRSPYCVEFLQPFSKLSNIKFTPHGIGRATLYVDFFNAPEQKQTFTIDLIQRDSNGTIVGGKTFIVESPVLALGNIISTCISDASTGEVQLTAEVSATSDVKWFTEDNKFVSIGHSLNLSGENIAKNYIAVTIDENGDLQTDYVEAANSITIMSVDPKGIVTSDLVISASIPQCTITIASLTSGNTIYSQHYPVENESLRIDMSLFRPDLYVISCIKDGNIIASHIFRKQ